MSRTAAPAGHDALGQRVLQALFSSDAIQNQRNTEAIEVGPNRLVAARVVKHSPARTQPLSEVKAEVQRRWVAQRSAELAREAGEAVLKAAQSGQVPTGLGDETMVSRDQPGNLPVDVLAAVMGAPATTLPSWTGVAQGDKGYTVVQITQVQARQPADAQRSQAERAQYRQWLAAAETAAYYETLKQRLKVKILVPAPKS